jgi:hypothetical protein
VTPAGERWLSVTFRVVFVSWGTVSGPAIGSPLLHFAVYGVVPAKSAKLLQLQPGGRLFLVLGSRVIPVLAVRTL